MSERWKEAIQNWYSQSHTSNLEYLDLATTTKVTSNQIAHNLYVVYDRTCLSARVNLRNFKLLLERCETLAKEVAELRTTLTNLTTVLVETRPLTKQEIIELITQPRREIAKLQESLNQKLEIVELLLQQVEKWTIA